MKRTGSNIVSVLAAAPLIVWPALGQTARVDYRLDSSWGTGLQAGLVITNTGQAALAGWRLTFTYPHDIGSIWEARIVSRSGDAYTIEGPGWNPNLAPGGQAWIGWVAATAGPPQQPSGCAMPGVTVTSATCGAAGPADTTPPSTPGNLRLSFATTTSIGIAWNASTDGQSGVAGYEVRMNGAAAGTTVGPSWTAVNLAPSTAYSFAVRARDTAGNYSALTPALTASTLSPPVCGPPPAVPGGLAVTGVTPNSAQVGWTAVAAGPGCTVTYTLWRDGAPAVSGLTASPYLLAGLVPSTTYSVAVQAVNQAGASAMSNAVLFRTADEPPPTTSAFPPRVFAPYADMLLWPTPDLAAISLQTGVKYFTVAFVNAGPGNQAAWGGIVPVSQDFLVPQIAGLRAVGGDVIVSFGGAFGLELAQAWTDTAALQSQYQAAIDKFRLTRVDFDIEGWAIADGASITRRNRAIAGLQAAARASGRPLHVQFTLPVLPTGLTIDGVALLRNAIDNGVDIGTVNIMAMDYGNAVADPYRMGDNAMLAVNSTFTQLQALYGAAKSAGQIRAMQGVTPMIGLNDVTPEVFTLTADAPRLFDFARAAGMGLLSMWSVGRDRACTGTPSVSPTCSGVSQSPYAFSAVFRGFTGY
ncbi:MAG: cellulose binding domain-containing protein [Bryobacteraceae bacterium]